MVSGERSLAMKTVFPSEKFSDYVVVALFEIVLVAVLAALFLS